MSGDNLLWWVILIFADIGVTVSSEFNGLSGGDNKCSSRKTGRLNMITWSDSVTKFGQYHPQHYRELHSGYANTTSLLTLKTKESTWSCQGSSVQKVYHTKLQLNFQLFGYQLPSQLSCTPRGYLPKFSHLREFNHLSLSNISAKNQGW